MKRIVATALGGLLLAACPSAKECATAEDCGPSAVCELGICVLWPDGGAGGGGAATGGGGGGGGLGGGNGGGGATGGGAGGGAAGFCEAAVEVSCQPWEECAPTVDGGRCESGGFMLRWVSPDAGAVFKVDVVSAALEVVRPDGGLVVGVGVPVVELGGDAGQEFTLDAGRYRGTLTLAPPDGEKTFVAGWPDGGGAAPWASLTILRDTTAPEVVVDVEARPAGWGDADPSAPGAWKKDEAAVVRVVVDGGRPAAPGDFITSWNGTVTQLTCDGGCIGCQCFAVDLTDAPLAGLAGTVPVAVRGIVDLAGNEAAQEVRQIQVTRRKWARQFALASSSSPLQPIAISQDGTILAAVSEAPATTPRLHALAQDGGLVWTALNAGALTAGPTVSRTGLWVAANIAAASQLRRISLVDQMLSAGDCLSVTGEFGAELALGFTDAGVEVPFGVRSQEIQAPVGVACRSMPLSTYPSSVAGRPALVTRNVGGAIETFIASDLASRLWKARLEGTSISPVGVIDLPATTQPRGLFFDGAQRAGGGGGGVVSGGAMFTVRAADALDAGTLASFSAPNSSAPVLASTALFFGTTTGDVVRLTYDAATGALAGGATLPSSQGESFQGRTPLLGASGLLYVVGDSGQLMVVQAASMTAEWGGSLATALTSVSQLAIDVHRGAGGVKECNKPGVLFVMTRSGSTATLHAVLVDSKGLQADAPWPKYQRDNGNTGNIDVPLAPWTCP